MKKLLLILMALVISVAMISCTNTNDVQDPTNNNQQQTDNLEGDKNQNEVPDTSNDEQTTSMDLKEMLTQVVTGITPEELVVDTAEVNDEMFPGFFFVDAPASEYEAYVSMPMIGSIAHQVAIVRVSDNTDTAALASEMEANLDPRKWICAEAEKTAVVTKDNVILVVMSTADVVDAAVEKFNAL